MTDSDEKRPTTPIGVNFKIPVRYWYPTIIAVIGITATSVWWFHDQIEPLETRIAKLEASRPGSSTAISDFPVTDIKQLYGLSPNEPLSRENQQKVDDVVFELTNQRRDLVLIVTGYIGQRERTGKAEDAEASEAMAQSIKAQLIARGLPANRVFAKGYGQDVPDSFQSSKRLNVALMKCDVLVLMRFFARA